MAVHILHLPLEPQVDVVVADLTLVVVEQVHRDLQVAMEMTVLAALRLAVVAAWEAQARQPLEHRAQAWAATA